MALTPNQLMKVLRLTQIPRWTIVPVLRQQTVGEHSYRVWVLVQEMAHAMESIPHNSDEALNLSNYALIHDLAEVAIGDMPTTLKAELNKEAPGLIHKIEHRALQEIHPEAASIERSVQNSIEKTVVKFCDTLEAFIYLSEYGVSNAYTHEVLNDLKSNLFKHFKEAQNKFPTRGWHNVPKWVSGLNPALGFELSTYLENDPED